MVRHIKPDTHGLILQLGPGTVSFTIALLRRGMPKEKLVLLEQSPDFTTLLRNSFPEATIICGDAKDVAATLRPFGIEEIDEIVSGIPLVAIFFWGG